jgi:hypothetical protein
VSGGTNLIVNPGFENGLTGWDSGGVIVSSPVYAGTKSLRMAGSAKYYSGQTVAVVPGAIYQIKAWCKLSASSASVIIAIQYPNGTEIPLTCNSTNWVQRSLNITIPSGQTSLKVAFWNDWGTVHWDDLSLIRQ